MRSIWSFFALFAAAFLGGCVSPQSENSLIRFEYEQPEMGVPFRIVLFAPSTNIAETAAQASFGRIAELNRIMSDYETDSELSKLSQGSDDGSPVTRVSSDLWQILALSQELAERSDGAFDITVGPAVALWRKARREQRLPDSARLAHATAKMGYTNIVLNSHEQTVQLLRRGMRLDLGGIAKGFAADEALRVLATHGVKRALVAASGDLAIGDPPPGESGWRVELSGYDLDGGPASKVIYCARKGISTSGDASQRLEIDGVRYSHVLNPWTGFAMTNHALGTVIAENCTISDALDTTCTILPAAKALALAARYGAEVRVIQLTAAKPEVVYSPRFPR